MASKDIEKLKEKFEKDPNSKLFLPLAEEYRKEGMLDEAIDVLRAGVEKHQAYTSAKVLLGKIYLEKGMLDEARREFEGVIASVPDNLFAHKKLAEIYRDTGEATLAIKAFKAILKLNPMDEDTLNNLKELEALAAGIADQGQPVVEETGAELKMPEEPADVLTYNEQISVEAADVQVEQSEEELNAFKDSLFGNKGPLSDEIELDTVQEEETASEISLPEEVAEESIQDLTFEETSGGAETEESPEPGLPAADREDAFSFEDAGEKVLHEKESTPEDFGARFEQGFNLAELPVEAEQEVTLEQDSSAGAGDEAIMAGDFMGDLMEDRGPEVPQPGPAAEELGDADRFIAEGKFSEAMGVYRKHLSADPHDKAVLQRVDELRALLKLLGKDKEVLIAKLDAFLDGVRKRRDEFFGRP
ncbi:MAG: tetratricopeptide repeat protein [Nitrospirae bacterium]|nr:tetratricopeptide repeat protein [Nitrospirota bacterium]